MSLNEEIAAIVRAAVADALETAKLASLNATKPAPLMKKAELAQYLQCSERQIDLLRLERGLPTRFVGDSPRFDRGEVDAWSRAQKVGEQ